MIARKLPNGRVEVRNLVDARRRAASARWLADGGRSLGFGARRVRSLPDAVARVLAEAAGLAADGTSAPMGAPSASRGDVCPSCGEATLLHREGCRTCPCGFSEY